MDTSLEIAPENSPGRIPVASRRRTAPALRPPSSAEEVLEDDGVDGDEEERFRRDQTKPSTDPR